MLFALYVGQGITAEDWQNTFDIIDMLDEGWRIKDALRLIYLLRNEGLSQRCGHIKKGQDPRYIERGKIMSCHELNFVLSSLFI